MKENIEFLFPQNITMPLLRLRKIILKDKEYKKKRRRWRKHIRRNNIMFIRGNLISIFGWIWSWKKKHTRYTRTQTHTYTYTYILSKHKRYSFQKNITTLFRYQLSILYFSTLNQVGIMMVKELFCEDGSISRYSLDV